jgi:hypothetical protein
MNQDNLWGSIPLPTDIRTPKIILSEQAQILSGLTNHVLVGQIETTVGQFGDVIIELVILAPFLNNYRINILHVLHKIDSVYPAIVRDYINWNPGGRDDPTEYKCETEDELKAALSTILQSDGVRKIIAGLLTQSVDYSSNVDAAKIQTAS